MSSSDNSDNDFNIINNTSEYSREDAFNIDEIEDESNKESITNGVEDTYIDNNKEDLDKLSSTHDLEHDSDDSARICDRPINTEDGENKEDDESKEEDETKRTPKKNK